MRFLDEFHLPSRIVRTLRELCCYNHGDGVASESGPWRTMAVVAQAPRHSSFVIFVADDFRAWILFWREELEKLAPDGLSTGTFFRFLSSHKNPHKNKQRRVRTIFCELSEDSVSIFSWIAVAFGVFVSYLE